MKLHAEWSNVSGTCAPADITQGRYNIIATTMNDLGQLVIMLIGLLRIRRENYGLLRYLYIQVGYWASRRFLFWLLTMVMQLD